MVECEQLQKDPSSEHRAILLGTRTGKFGGSLGGRRDSGSSRVPLGNVLAETGLDATAEGFPASVFQKRC